MDIYEVIQWLVLIGNGIVLCMFAVWTVEVKRALKQIVEALDGQRDRTNFNDVEIKQIKIELARILAAVPSAGVPK